MYKIKNEEKGAALVMVLWIIVLLVLLGTILSAQLLTTTKQMKRQEESATMTDITNMATVYVSTYIKQNGETDGIKEDGLSALVNNVPKSIDIDGYKVFLTPKLQLDQNRIELTVSVKINEKESNEIKYIPISE